MIVKTVSYQKTFNLGNYCSERIGLEMELEEGKTIEETLDEAKKIATEWHEANNPQLYGKKAYVDDYNPNGSVYTAMTDSNSQKVEISKSPNNPETIRWEINNEDPIKKRTTTLVDAINSCKEIKVLESYKLMVRGKEELQTAYDKKLKELSK